MLVTFKSKAAAEIVMYEEHAKALLDLLHKDVKRGVVSVGETAAAVAKLESAIHDSKADPSTEENARNAAARHEDGGENRDYESTQPVSFAARAYPLLEMLRAAHRSGDDVLWGI